MFSSLASEMRLLGWSPEGSHPGCCAEGQEADIEQEGPRGATTWPYLSLEATSL